jgi:hypothetical protein
MSAMSSDGVGTAFAAVAAVALRRELSLPRWAGRRLLLRELHGLSAGAVFQALLSPGSHMENIDVYPDGPSGARASMTALVSDSGTDMVPYLVDDQAATPNSGTGGYAANLRTHFLEGATQPRVLLILAGQPQETIASATEDASALESLKFIRLCKAAALPGEREPQPPRLIREVVDDYAARIHELRSGGWREAETLRTWVATHHDDTDEAIGRSLYELRIYVPDPQLHPAVASRRLQQSAGWRTTLEQWASSPGADLARKLASKRVGVAGIDAVLAAETVRGLDYSRITLPDLQDRGVRPPVLLDRIAPVEGARVALKGADALALWLPRAGGGLQFRLNRPLARGESVRLRWQGSTAALLQVRGSAAVASVAPPAEGDWRFGWLELLEDKVVTARYPLAAGFSDADIWAFEEALEVDAEIGGFTCGETPRLAIWSAGGSELGTAELASGEDREGDPVRQVTGTFEGAHVGPVPIIPARASEGEEAERDAEPSSEVHTNEEAAGGADTPGGGQQHGTEGGEANGDPDADEDDLLGGLGSGRGEYPPAAAEQPTLAHAMLAFRQAQWPDGPSTPSAVHISARFEAVQLRVRPRADDVDLLPAEKAILEHPEWCMFAVDGATCAPLREFPRPETSWSRELGAFMRARERYFAAALNVGSTYALDPRCEVAVDYTASYRALLDALPRDTTSRTEYDDLLLVDRAEVQGVADLLLAPTSPLTVAWHAELARRLSHLAAAGADIDRADINAFTPQHLLPLLMSNSDWYEARPSEQALLWRRYVPLAASSRGAYERNASFIAGRIAFFLSVHPSLNRPDTTIPITFADPGDGKAAVNALREFFRRDRALSGYRRPRIRAVLAGADRGARRSIDELFSGAAENDLDRIVRTRTDLIATDDAAPPAFSDVTFLFRSPGSRGVRPVRLDQRASTSYARSLAASLGRVLVPDADYVFATGTFCAVPGLRATDLEAIQYSSLELVGGSGGERLEPGWTRMVTATASEEQLAHWYDRSAWVVHLDRLVGLEAFADTASPRTILEYEDDADPASFGYDGITGTRYVDPYLAAMRRALAGVAAPGRDEARALMRLLEAVSGRWALQIVQRPLPKVLERAGTACAVRYVAEIESALEAGRGSFSALVSLEEIVPGFPAEGIPRRLISSRSGRGSMCDDLLLLTVQTRGSEPPLVQATVIEVKFWQAGGADYSYAADQVEETIEWLRARFCEPGDVADLRGRDLAELIRAASTRNSTFGLAPALLPGAEDTLGRISSGSYELSFGHWRRDGYRRGLVVAVEHRQAGNLELSQLNATNGPIDLVTIRSGLTVPALEMQALATPPGWVQLAMWPPPRDGTVRIAVAGEPSPQPSAGSRPESTGVGDELEQDARRLGEAFARYGLTIEPFRPDLAQVGPSVIRFRTRAIGRLSITDVERRSRDISREVGAAGEVSIGDEPGFITVDVPRAERQLVPLSVALATLDAAEANPGALSFVPGVAPSGEVRIADLSRLPHLLVSGATGSGKSVFLRGLVVELLRKRTAEQLQLLIIDPKRLDFLPFNAAPHLRGGEIISDPTEALERLRFTLEAEIELRQPVLANADVSSAAEYYEAGGSLEELPQLVILVDEFADLVLAGPDRRAFSEMIQRYAQLTRAYGIFLVLATQRPSVDVVTGSIKANLSARIAFSLPSARDSMTILDRGGAEDLLGNGDLLFYRNGRVERLQAPLTTLADVRAALR